MGTLGVMIYVMLMQLIAIITFLSGFLQPKIPHQKYSSYSELPTDVHGHPLYSTDNISRPYSSQFDRVVFMVIDAWRSDFIYGPDGTQHMPFLSSLLQSDDQCNFIARAQTPTVTMPRIKALTSGDVPSFLDVILNLGSTVYDEDNLINQATTNGLRVVFYGDETWLKLFPHHFKRSEGTTSFFVSDYTEVDNNVTRHLNKELEDMDWDMMILHYLGLDHIGHLVGPQSPLIRPKLQQMDSIVQKIYTSLQQSPDRTLLILSGDHGMSDVGSHGGASTSEVMVPLIFLSDSYQGKCDKTNRLKLEVDQIDLTPTLSVLLGLPIPYNNLGNIILPLLSLFDTESQMYILYYNALQMFGFESKQGKNVHLLEEAEHLHLKYLQGESIEQTEVFDAYLVVLRQEKTHRIAALTRYDHWSMTLGILMSIQSLWFLLCGEFTLSMLVIAYSCYLANVFHMLFFWWYLYATNPIVDMIKIFSGFLFTLNMQWCVNIPILNHSTNFEMHLKIRYFLIFGTILHTLSLGSSSLVEEEHQTWYFLWTTLQVTILLNFLHEQYTLIEVTTCRCKSDKSCRHSIKHHPYYECTTPSTWQCVICKGYYRSPYWNRLWNSIDWKNVSFVILLLFLHRLLRSWNQTGDKWSYLSDIGDWLLKPENSDYLGLGTISALILISMMWKPKPVIDYIVFNVGLSCILLYREATSHFTSFVSPLLSARGITEVQASFLSSIIILLRGFMRMREERKINKTSNKHLRDMLCSIIRSWILLCCALHKPHNVLMMSLMLLEIQVLHLYLRDAVGFDMISVAMIHVWGSQVGYFYQGNSNSIASIDVSSAFVGMESYSPTIAGFFVICATYSSTILWLLMLALFVVKEYDNAKFCNPLELVWSTVICCRILPVTVFLIVTEIQRHHIFVWSVFAPKVLYEGMLTLVSFVMVLILCISQFLWTN